MFTSHEHDDPHVRCLDLQRAAAEKHALINLGHGVDLWAGDFGRGKLIEEQRLRAVLYAVARWEYVTSQFTFFPALSGQ